ncbi:LysM peptidoglycan-binding domain-containing protein [Levilactobacillus zymae]|nr:LysM peptidoglycan-binding domain-containing protein [Levilactobacillus zymae]
MINLAKTNSFKPVGQVLINQREVPFATYRVQEGDTVYGLWLKLRDKTTVGALNAANGLQGNELAAGKTLKIPLVV